MGIAGYRAIMKQIYSPRKYYQRARRVLKELKLPLAVTPAIYGYHYRKICELHIR